MKHWRETAAIIGRVLQLASTGRRAALATVVHIAGSSYRRPGAKFLVEDDGRTLGGVSAAYTNHPPGMEAGLEAVNYYDPPNLTFPFGSYIAVIDIDRGTGVVTVRRFMAVDDCGNIINPMIVEGQVHGGLSMGLAPALYRRSATTKRAISRVAASWTIWCQRRWRRRSGRPTRR